MCRIKFLAMLSIVTTVVLLVEMSSSTLTMAAPPTPASSLVDGFVLETDKVYGYEMLRPASWTSLDLGDRRGYLPVNSAGQSDRIMLAVTNLKTVSDAFAEKSGLVANYELFQQDPSLSAWMPKVETLWKSNGLHFEVLDQLPNAAVYAVKPDSNQIQIVAYVVNQGQPLGIALYGFGTFSDLKKIQGAGLLTDFETMVVSAVAHQSSPAPTALALAVPDLTVSPNSGPFHSDSGNRQSGVYTYRLQTDYYQAPSRVYWLYEYMHYGGDSSHDTWLYRTNVTDYPQTACYYGGSSLIEHPIQKIATRSNGNTATDSYYPNQVVAHLNTTTAHMMVFGDPLTVICQWYFPFTHQ